MSNLILWRTKILPAKRKYHRMDSLSIVISVIFRTVNNRHPSNYSFYTYCALIKKRLNNRSLWSTNSSMILFATCSSTRGKVRAKISTQHEHIIFDFKHFQKGRPLSKDTCFLFSTHFWMYTYTNNFQNPILLHEKRLGNFQVHKKLDSENTFFKT